MTRPLRRFAVFGFASTHEALDAEALLSDLGVGVVPIPTPRSLGSTCGIALRLELADEERAIEYLKRSGLAVAACVEMDDV